MSHFPIKIQSRSARHRLDGTVIEVGRIPVAGDFLEIERGGRCVLVESVFLLLPGTVAARVTFVD